MADHIRQQLREAVALAVTGLTTTGVNVHQARIDDLQPSELPALLVSTRTESSELTSASAPMIYQSVVDVLIEGVAAADEDLDDTLDEIALEVEVELADSVTVSGKGVLLLYQGCDINFDGASELAVGSIALRYSATLFHEALTPDIAA